MGKKKDGSRDARVAEKEAKKADRLATTAVRMVNHLAGDKMSPSMVRLLGELLGTGTNFGLSALSGLGIPGVSAAAGIAGNVSNWIGFYARPSRSRGIAPSAAVNRAGPSRPISRKGRGGGMLLERGITTCRSHFNLQAAHGIDETSVPLAPDTQLVPFAEAEDIPGGRISSNRVYLGACPATAVAGDVLLSVPLDLLTGPLTGSKAAYDSAQFDFCTWLASAFVYLPTSAATNSGGLILVFSPDPTRSIADVPHEQRVAAAFQYGPNMLASNLWSTGMTFKLAMDRERKYQQFSTAVDSDEALKLGGAGRVEIICSQSFDLDSSPGMFAMDLELMLAADVPVLQSFSDTVTTGFMFRDVASPPGSINCPVNNTLLETETSDQLPFGIPGSQNSSFDFMTKSGPSHPLGSLGAFSQTDAGEGAGGLQVLGWKYQEYTSTNGHRLSVPPGTWFLHFTHGSTKWASGGEVSIGSGTATVTQFSQFEATVANTPDGKVEHVTATITAGALGGDFYINKTDSPVLNNRSAAGWSSWMSITAGRVRVADVSPLMDQWVRDKLSKQGRIGSSQVHNIITDKTEYYDENDIEDLCPADAERLLAIARSRDRSFHRKQEIALEEFKSRAVSKVLQK